MGSMASPLESEKGDSAAETNLFRDERCVFQIRRKGEMQCGTATHMNIIDYLIIDTCIQVGDISLKLCDMVQFLKP